MAEQKAGNNLIVGTFQVDLPCNPNEKIQKRKITFNADGTYLYKLVGTTTMKLFPNFECEHRIEFFENGTFKATYYTIDKNYPVGAYSKDCVSFPRGFRDDRIVRMFEINDTWHDLHLTITNIDTKKNCVDGKYNYSLDYELGLNVRIGDTKVKVRFDASTSTYSIVQDFSGKYKAAQYDGFLHFTVNYDRVNLGKDNWFINHYGKVKQNKDGSLWLIQPNQYSLRLEKE
jgi:hypothetical protein